MTPPIPSLKEMLAALIATPSISSIHAEWNQSNLPLLALLTDWLTAAGFRVEQLPVPHHPDKANLIATLGAGNDGLVLAGHTDTVPIDAARWQYDPFQLTEDNGRLYGLGMCDMKSFFALVLEATRGLTAAELKRPLVILATADEESSMLGARALAATGRSIGRYAVIGEPTNLQPIRLHKGVMGESIQLHGRSGHASDPSLGNSALEGMHAVLTALFAWRDTLKTRYVNHAFPVAWPTINFGAIHGGDNPNRICGSCELQVDMRVLPGLQPETLHTELSTQVARIAQSRGLQWTVTPLFDSIPSGETPADSLIVRIAEELTGQPAAAVSFGTELPFFNQLGMETIVLGPGDIAQAHQPDEFLAIDRIPPTLTLIQQLVRRFCLFPD
ncbi:acetylornithine deacetylase [Thiospirillum jenense]|uniref:Acetylornithine deacetylase n=1 Tax=Thiospirillum jenense TaxID=1653858 RepID=A0A839HDE8_9GAMM|nr:acetylornithine deacetylase [Thiospirillum jenense]MBB1126661.1 acetylornithine deacetylase [Thiospirillum jenense]